MAMSDPETTAFVRDLMTDFAERTGLVGERAPTRYLWTDAFAVCNYLGLGRATGEEDYTGLALRLVEQVHHTLGRHRDDDARTGWISGLEKKKSGTTFINTSSGIDYEKEEHAGHDHNHGEMDPHVWMSASNARAMVLRMMEELMVHYPEYAGDHR